MTTRRRPQEGAVLVITLIMLVLLTLFALAAINMSTVNLRVTANSQVRAEAVAAAQSAIEVVVSSNFPAAPQARTISVPITSNATTTYNVEVAKPECKNLNTIKMADLDIAAADDVACFMSGSVANSGIAPPASAGDSVCASRQWDVVASVNDAAGSGAAVTVHQGIGQRVPVGSNCP